ncbi:MAG: hypothetical protein ACLRIS_06915 [Flavonifractor plautii]
MAIIVSFLAAGGSLTTNAANYGELFSKGLYGIGIAAVGMLSPWASPWPPTPTAPWPTTPAASPR